MKRIFIYGFLAAALLSSCGNSEKLDAAQQELANQEALNKATREELENAISERDELLDIINGISSNIDEIKNVEKIISINRAGEANNKSEINNSIDAIRATLADRRQKLASLEAKLKDSKLSNNKLLETVENLKKQIDAQEQQIATLTASLATANRRIGELDTQVDSLNTTVKDVTAQRNQAQEDAVQQANLANECYYAIGSKSELKDHGILQSGFLRKTKIMQGDFDKSYFVKADKRYLSSIQLHSNKAKVITTSQPTNSYKIVDEGGQKVLYITNPADFWGVSNYVVIQID